jgi:hypothetical protein
MMGGFGLQCLLVFLLTGLYIAPLLPLGLNLYDEGILLHGAERVLAGEVPYFDFFAYYGPAHFYWPAMLFKLFGTRVLAVRLGGILLTALATTFAFALCRRVGLSLSWSLVPAVALVLPRTSGVALTFGNPALAFMLGAGAILTASSGGGRRDLFAGLLLGITAIFRQDFGVYGVAAGMAAVLWRNWWRLREGADRLDRLARVLSGIRRLGWLLGGVAIVTIPVYGLLALRGVRELASALVVQPRNMMPFRTLPYGYYELPRLYESARGYTGVSATITDALSGIVLFGPLATLAVCVGLLVPRARRHIAPHSDRAIALVFVMVAAVGLAVYALGRSDKPHVYPLYVMSICALSIFWGSGSTVIKPRFGAVNTMILVGVSFALGTMFVARTVPFAGAEHLGLLHAGRIRIPASLGWVRDAVRDISSYGAEGPIFVAGERHDRVHFNAVMLYFLSGRPSGTYYFDFIPGVTTTSAVQHRIVSDLRRTGVRTIVVWKTVLPNEPNRSSESSGVHVLDEFLRSEFRPVKQTRDYEILVRRDRESGDATSRSGGGQQ